MDVSDGELCRQDYEGFKSTSYEGGKWQETDGSEGVELLQH